MPASRRKVPLLFAHPSLDRSEVNVDLLHASRRVEGLTVVDLYAEYPDYRIDIERGSRSALEEDRVGEHVAGWLRVLEGLGSGRLDARRAAALNKLKDDLDAVLGGAA